MIPSHYDHSNLNIKQLDGSSLRHSFSCKNERKGDINVSQ